MVQGEPRGADARPVRPPPRLRPVPGSRVAALVPRKPASPGEPPLRSASLPALHDAPRPHRHAARRPGSRISGAAVRAAADGPRPKNVAGGPPRRMSAEADDTRWMRRALTLAARARGRTAPNPMVGAVV